MGRNILKYLKLHWIMKLGRTQFADELFECVWPFCGIVALRVKYSLPSVFSTRKATLITS